MPKAYKLLKRPSVNSVSHLFLSIFIIIMSINVSSHSQKYSQRMMMRLINLIIVMRGALIHFKLSLLNLILLTKLLYVFVDLKAIK